MGPSATCWALHSTTWHSTTGTKQEAQSPGASCHARGTWPQGEEQQRSLVLCTHKVQPSPVQIRELCSRTRTIHTHERTPCTLLCVQGTACSQALPHAHTRPPAAALSTTVPTHAEGSLPLSLPHMYTPAGRPPTHPLCVPCHPSLPGQHSKVHLETSARKPVGRDYCGPTPFPSPCLTLRKLIPKLLRPQCHLP